MVTSAGGRTQLAQLTTSAIVLLVLLFLTGPLSYMPNAVLASVVFLIGIELVDLPGMRTILAQRLDEFVVALLTAGVVVFVGVEQGILLAVVLSLLDHVRRGYKPKNALVVADERHGWRTVPLANAAPFLPGLLVYRFASSLYYANANLFSEELIGLVQQAQPPVSWLCVDAASINDVDFSGAATLREAHATLQEQGVRLVFAEMSPLVRSGCDRCGIAATVGTDAFFATVAEMAEAFQQRTATPTAETSATAPAPTGG
jgi:MFS superfamily sulfate permease-like transporter